MKIKTIKQLEGTERDVKGVGFTSFRILLKKDGMGFTMTKTVIKKGVYHWHYKKHLEACYCVRGHAELKNIDTGETFEIKEDVTYILDSHDNHSFEAFKDTVLICVFNPPLNGREVHKEDGSYE